MLRVELTTIASQEIEIEMAPVGQGKMVHDQFT